MKKLLLLTVILFTSYYHSAAQWASGGTQMSFDDNWAERVTLSPTSDGGFYVTWIDIDTVVGEGTVKLSAYDSLGIIRDGWTHGGITISLPGDNYAPEIVTTSDDGVVVAWYGYVGGNNYTHVYLQKYSLTGTALWNGGATLQLTAGANNNYRYPIMASDTKKGVFVAPTRYDLGMNFGSTDILLYHLDSTGNTATNWASTGLEMAVTDGRETNPRLALTKDASHIYVAHAVNPPGDSTHLVVKKFRTEDGAVATGWGALGVDLSKGKNINPRINCNFWMYVDSLDYPVALWLDGRPPYNTMNWEIYMNRVTPAGIPMLGEYGKYIAGGPAFGVGSDYLEVKQDKDYNLIVTFNNRNTVPDYAPSVVDVYKLSPDGTTVWSKKDIAGFPYSYCPKAVPDGMGGTFTIYQDVQNFQLRALEIDKAGQFPTGWNAPGVNFGRIASTNGFNPNYDFHAIASSQPGKAIVGWTRRTPENLLRHVYVCNVSSDGSICGHDISTGVEKPVTVKEGCAIFPNPVGSHARVVMNDEIQTGNITVSLYDLTGKEIKIYNIDAGGNDINTSLLSSGMYLYKVMNGNTEIGKGKLIKQ